MSTLDREFLGDMPLTAIASRSTMTIDTGTWKYLEPRYEDKLPPCSHACPAGNDISKLIALLASGDQTGAVQLLRAANPLPATLGRVCPHFCEQHCNRESLGGAITIHMLERFLGELPFTPPPTLGGGGKVAVVGAGPAGITAAYLLARAGHEVEVFDDKPKPGGYLRTGIPDYRLPKEVLDREIALVEGVGVKFTQNARVGRDITFEELKSRFDAVIVAVGLHAPRRLAIPGIEHLRVYDGVELLEQILLGQSLDLPRKVAVIGGGNTAIDVARSLLRLGVKPTVVYRRTQAEMPAIASEVAEAKQEGVAFHLLAAPTAVVLRRKAIVALECTKMQLGAPDQSGRRAPEPIPDSNFRISVSGVVLAIGETADMEFLPESLRRAKLAGGPEGIFFAGDASTNDGTVTAAVGSGRRVAARVGQYLRSRSVAESEPSLQSLWSRPVNVREVVDLQHLNPAYFSPEPSPKIQKSNGATPPTTFKEIVKGFGAESALCEARRCFGCGTCNGCLNCYYWCPDIAIHGSSPIDLHIDADHCKGCGICVEECPRGAMALKEAGQ
jgi:NADPH-dependent glutamate synthase beta subunit-like oxidoreductase